MGRSGLRGACYCEWFRVIFGTKLGGVLLFRVGFKKNVWLWFLALEAGSWHGRSSSSSISRRQHQHHHQAAAADAAAIQQQEQQEQQQQPPAAAAWQTSRSQIIHQQEQQEQQEQQFSSRNSRNSRPSSHQQQQHSRTAEVKLAF